MTHLTEDRLRTLLEERAAQAVVSPDALARIRARVGEVDRRDGVGFDPDLEEDNVVDLRVADERAVAADRRRWIPAAAAAALLVAVLMAGVIALASDDDPDVAAPAGVGDVGTAECPHDLYEEGTLLGSLAADGRFDRFVCLVESAGARLVTELQVSSDETLFVPTDEALGALGEDVLQSLYRGEMTDVDGLGVRGIAIVFHHWVPEPLPPGDLVSGAYTTVGGADVDVVVDGDDIRVNDARVIDHVDSPIGVVYAVDAIVSLPTA